MLLHGAGDPYFFTPLSKIMTGTPPEYVFWKGSGQDLRQGSQFLKCPRRAIALEITLTIALTIALATVILWERGLCPNRGDHLEDPPQFHVVGYCDFQNLGTVGI